MYLRVTQWYTQLRVTHYHHFCPFICRNTAFFILSSQAGGHNDRLRFHTEMGPSDRQLIDLSVQSALRAELFCLSLYLLCQGHKRFMCNGFQCFLIYSK